MRRPHPSPPFGLDVFGRRARPTCRFAGGGPTARLSCIRRPVVARRWPGVRQTTPPTDSGVGVSAWRARSTCRFAGGEGQRRACPAFAGQWSRAVGRECARLRHPPIPVWVSPPGAQQCSAMAIYHMSSKPISRSKGRSAVAAVAYRAGCQLKDELHGLTHNYSKRHGVEYTGIIAPDRQPVDRQQLWNAAESRENRKNARTAREYEVALPAELNKEQHIALVKDFAAMLCDRNKIVVDFAIHAPDKEGDKRNHHAHLICTTREASRSEGGAIILGQKTSIELSNKKRKEIGIESETKDELKQIRAQWASLANKHLGQAGQTARIDHRSYKERGIDLPPTKHMGLAATAMERQGKKSERAELHAEQQAEQTAIITQEPSLLINTLASSQIIISRQDLRTEAQRYLSEPAAEKTVTQLEQSGNLIILPNQTNQSTTNQQIYTTPKSLDRAVEIARTSGYEHFSELKALAKDHQHKSQEHHNERHGRNHQRGTGPNQGLTLQISERARQQAIRERRETGPTTQHAPKSDPDLGARDDMRRLFEQRMGGDQKQGSAIQYATDHRGEDSRIELASILSDIIRPHDSHLEGKDHQERSSVVLPPGADRQTETLARPTPEPDQPTTTTQEPERGPTDFMTPGPRTGEGQPRLWLDPASSYEDRKLIKATEQAAYDKTERAWHAINPEQIDKLTQWLPPELKQLREHEESRAELAEILSEIERPGVVLPPGADRQTETLARPTPEPDQPTTTTQEPERGPTDFMTPGPRTGEGQPRLWLDPASSYEDRKLIKATGQAAYDKTERAWHAIDPEQIDKLIQWLPPELKQLREHEESRAELAEILSEIERPGVVLPPGADRQTETLARPTPEPDQPTTTTQEPERGPTDFMTPGPRTGEGQPRLWLDPASSYEDRKLIKATGQAAYDKTERAWHAIDPEQIDKLIQWLPPELKQLRESGAAHTSPGEPAAAQNQEQIHLNKITDRATHTAIRKTGQAKWDEDQETWQVIDQGRMDKLIDWLPQEHRAEATRQAEQYRPEYEADAAQKQQQDEREAEAARQARGQRNSAINAVDQRQQLINETQVRIVTDTKEWFRETESRLEESIKDLGNRPIFGREQWETTRRELEQSLEKTKSAYIDWTNDSATSQRARQWATATVDANNQQLAELARHGEEIIAEENQEARYASMERDQQKKQSKDQEKSRSR